MFLVDYQSCNYTVYSIHSIYVYLILKISALELVTYLYIFPAMVFPVKHSDLISHAKTLRSLFAIVL